MKNAWKLVAVVGLALTVHGATGSSPAPDHAPKPAAVKPAAKPETKATAKPESKPESKAENKPESKPETKAAGKSDSKPAADDQHDDHDSADPKSDNKSDNKADSKSDNKPAAASHADVTKAMDPDAALKLLQEGNERWVSGKFENPNTSAERRTQQATEGQTPFVTVLTCADSRMPVERVFDRGVGEVFVIRVAGNVAGPHEAGTIEYGAGHLNSRLLVVMGHTKCGAVAAAASDGKFNQNVGSLVENIKPAVERAKSNGAPEGAGLVAAAVKENVWQSVFDLLRTSPDLCKMVKAGQVKIVGAVCDVSTGKVEWMGEHPWQDALVQAFTSRDTATANAESHDGH